MEVLKSQYQATSKETRVKLRNQKREVWSHRPSREFATVQGDSMLATVQNLAAERRATVQRETPKILKFLRAIICGTRRRS